MRLPRVLTRGPQQVKRVIGADPRLDLNVSAIRELGDAALLRLALQAVLGNFTAGAGPGWQQACTVVVEPATGELVVQAASAATDMALRVLVIALCGLHFKRWVEDELRAPRRV